MALTAIEVKSEKSGTPMVQSGDLQGLTGGPSNPASKV
jgi:hypothetical protein